jgi:hypothetical protein
LWRKRTYGCKRRATSYEVSLSLIDFISILIYPTDAFEPGVEAFNQYLVSLQGNEQDFSPTKLLAIIDSFGPALATHLADEIPTLLALSRFGSKIPFTELSVNEMRKASGAIPKTEGLPFFLLNLDRTFEDGLWEYWPPIPGPVRWVLIRVIARTHTGWWRFASCDYDGKPQKLYATE